MNECGICYDFLKIKKYKYCSMCNNIYYCKDCIKNLKKYNFLSCPYCRLTSIEHYYNYFKNLLKPIKRQYNKCLFKFLQDKEQYGKRNRLIYFNKEKYNDEYILISKDLYNIDCNILKIFISLLNKDFSLYTNEIIKACNYLISVKN